VTSDFSSSQVRIYYYVNSALTEIKFDADGTWKQAQALPTFNATTERAPPPDNTTVPAVQPTHEPGGLSSGAKAGVGVGVTLGVLAIAGVLGALFFLRRRERLRQQQQQQQQQQTGMPEMENTAALDPNKHPAAVVVEYDAHGNPVYDHPTTNAGSKMCGGSPPPGYGAQKAGPQQLEGSEVPLELEGPRLMYELPDRAAYSHELVGDGVGAELPGDGAPGRKAGW
jgi:hypothetical protein